MVQPGRPPNRPTIVGLPLVYQEEAARAGAGQWKMRFVEATRGGNLETRTLDITDTVARSILGLSPLGLSQAGAGRAEEPREYVEAVQEEMAALADAPVAQKSSAEKRLTQLLFQPIDKKKPKTEWQLPAERMRARLEKARQVAEGALRSGSLQIPEALTAQMDSIRKAEFVTGAAAVSSRSGEQVIGRMQERTVGAETPSLAGVPHREEPRALLLEIQRTLRALQERQPVPRQLRELKWIEDKFAVDEPDRVWGDAENRTLLRFCRDFLSQVAAGRARDAGSLEQQDSIFANRSDSGSDAHLWYVARWADLLRERADNKAGLLGPAVKAKRAEILSKLAEARETPKGKEARNALTQSKEIMVRAARQPQELSEDVQRLVHRDRGSFVVELQRPDEPSPDLFVVSHRYDPEAADSGDPDALKALMATNPSLLGKERAVLTSARQVLDVESGQSILAHGRWNTADRVLDAQTAILSELYEDPKTAPLATKVFLEGVAEHEKSAYEVLLRKMTLPTGLSWETTQAGKRIKWQREGSVWKPCVDLATIDLNLMTPGMGGPDTGDQPEWAPATALWNRGEKGKAIALVLGRLLGLGLPYVVELAIARFLAEQRWSEQEAALTQLMHGEQFQILGIPVRLQTMMITRAFNVFGERGLMRSLLGVQKKEQQLSERTKVELHDRLKKKQRELERQEKDLMQLLRKPDAEVKKEYLALLGSDKPEDRLRAEYLFDYLRAPRARLEQQLESYARSKARLEGMWQVAFDPKLEPETQAVALVELAKELNVRICAHCKSGKDRTGNFVALFIATRQYFKRHPEPDEPADEKWKDPAEWATYVQGIVKDPLFNASAEVVDEVLNQQQADMMQMNRTLDRAKVSGRLMGQGKVPSKTPRAMSYYAGQSQADAASRARNQERQGT